MRQDTPQNPDLVALRSFVTAQDGSTPYGPAVHHDTVVVDLSHENLQQRHIEIRVSKHTKVKEIYHLIHRKTGSAVDDQILQVYDVAGQLMLSALPAYDHKDAARPVAYFGIDRHGMRIHCVDTNPHAISARGSLENTALVEKYVMGDAEYEQRKGTLRSWAKEQKQQDPSFTLEKHAKDHKALHEAVRYHKLGMPLPEGFILKEGKVVATPKNPESEDFGAESVSHCKEGDRCQIQPGGRRGRVAWVGSIGKEEFWVGVVLDEPGGHNDGTFRDGKRYFEAPSKYGVYCRGKNVETGDFPERDIFDSDDEDEL